MCSESYFKEKPVCLHHEIHAGCNIALCEQMKGQTSLANEPGGGFALIRVTFLSHNLK